MNGDDKTPNFKTLQTLLKFFEDVIGNLKGSPGLVLAATFGVLIGFALPIVLFPLLARLPPELLLVFALALIVALVAIFFKAVSGYEKRNKPPGSLVEAGTKPESPGEIHLEYKGPATSITLGSKESKSERPRPAWRRLVYFLTTLVFTFTFTLTIVSLKQTINISAFGGSPVLPTGKTTGGDGDANIGKTAPTGSVFPVDLLYVASGKMGDEGDVEFGGTNEGYIFTYKPRGAGDHNWRYEFNPDGSTNNRPAKFAGVVWLNPPDAFGTDPHGGYDLRGFKTIKWSAKSLGDPVNVEFFIGGIDSIWGESNGRPAWVGAPYPDTMPRIGLGTKHLTSYPQEFEVSLADQPEKNFKRVVGGFGWVAGWGSNEVAPNDEGTGPKTNRVFQFEVQDVRYER